MRAGLKPNGLSMLTSTSTLRVLEPAPNIVAFYDGRIANTRLYSEETNWLDNGAYSLGVASYVVYDGNEALVFDTHISIAHGYAIRQELENRGVTSFRVVLSHYHHDHVAGNEAFKDCEIIASRKTEQALLENQQDFATGAPSIDPLVMPTTIFEGEKTLHVGDIEITLRPLEIHSFDGLVLYLPKTRILLAADTLEDTVTYVDEPQRLGVHLTELDRLSTWDIATILPSHGDPDRIASGGYEDTFIKATRDYVAKLLHCPEDAKLGAQTLREFVAADIESGALIYFDAYEQVHRDNVKAVLCRG